MKDERRLSKSRERKKKRKERGGDRLSPRMIDSLYKEELGGFLSFTRKSIQWRPTEDFSPLSPFSRSDAKKSFSFSLFTCLPYLLSSSSHVQRRCCCPTQSIEIFSTHRRSLVHSSAYIRRLEGDVLREQEEKKSCRHQEELPFPRSVSCASPSVIQMD